MSPEGFCRPLIASSGFKSNGITDFFLATHFFDDGEQDNKRESNIQDFTSTKGAKLFIVVLFNAFNRSFRKLLFQIGIGLVVHIYTQELFWVLFGK